VALLAFPIVRSATSRRNTKADDADARDMPASSYPQTCRGGIADLRHTFASLLLQQGESIVYVKEHLGHASIQITVDTYGQLIPGANRAAVDKLDDLPAQPTASPAQPETASADQRDRRKLFGMSGEPRRNRTYNPQIKSLLLCQLS
jgi:hypothetical protein